MSITLPNEMARIVREKVAAGENASESEVVRVGLRTLMARGRAMEDWLRHQVAPAHDALRADPKQALYARRVRATLAVEHKKTAR
jgi:antitoxin ParD1/3/4